MSALKATATLELGVGEKNRKGVLMKTNRFRVEGDISGTIYIKDTQAKSFEISLK
jgi:hypothetical protein